MKDIFEIQPLMSKPEYGPEPNLRQMVEKYYEPYFPEKCEEMAQKYLAKVLSEIKTEHATLDKNKQIAEALKTLVWPNMAIGNKVIIQSAIDALCTTPSVLGDVDEREAFNMWNNEDNLPIAGVGAKNAAWLAWQARAKLGNLMVSVIPDKIPHNVYDAIYEQCDANAQAIWDVFRKAILERLK